MKIEAERVNPVRDGKGIKGECVVYWMQMAKRSEFNQALEYAIERANEADLEVKVIFAVLKDFPEATLRQYRFMLEGIGEVEKSLAERGIAFELVVLEDFADLAGEIKKLNPRELITEKAYLRFLRKWRRQVYGEFDCAITEVETEVVVPVEVVSDKAEYAARTIRPKIKKHWRKFWRVVEPGKVKNAVKNRPMKWEEAGKMAEEMGGDQSVGGGDWKGGRAEAVRLLKKFLEEKLENYGEMRNQPSRDYLSEMSPYLHHGQISALEVAMRVESAAKKAGIEAGVYLEELIVRRELAINFCYFNQQYDVYEEAVPDWAQRSLDEHRNDKRVYEYGLRELEAAETHDEIWNACQRQMVRSGKMHGYMRMYWGKKIMEWCAEPKKAFEVALYLNNKYELDGYEPNGYVGVAWCFGLHDRPWFEREIFGKVRYMNDSGLKRKIKDLGEYVEKWS